jgi:hypothetical protein
MLGEPVHADGTVVHAPRFAPQQNDHDTDREYCTCPDRDPNHRYLAVMPNAVVCMNGSPKARSARVGEQRRDDVYRPGHA